MSSVRHTTRVARRKSRTWRYLNLYCFTPEPYRAPIHGRQEDFAAKVGRCVNWIIWIGGEQVNTRRKGARVSDSTPRSCVVLFGTSSRRSTWNGNVGVPAMSCFSSYHYVQNRRSFSWSDVPQTQAGTTHLHAQRRYLEGVLTRERWGPTPALGSSSAFKPPGEVVHRPLIFPAALSIAALASCLGITLVVLLFGHLWRLFLSIHSVLPACLPSIHHASALITYC